MSNTIEDQTNNNSCLVRPAGQDPTPGNKIRAIFFDMDNTLIETRKADILACEKVASLLVLEFTVPKQLASKIVDTFLLSFRVDCRRAIDETKTLRERRVQLWKDALGPKYASHAEAIFKKWHKIRLHFLVIEESTVKLLRDLRTRYYLALITNGPSDCQWEKVTKLEMEDLFDAVMVSGDHGFEKPGSEIFNEVCQTLDVHPIECLMVGDRKETDIEGGFNAQLGIVVWFQLPGDCLNDICPNPDFIIKDIQELKAILGVGPEESTIKRTRRASTTSKELLGQKGQSIVRPALVPNNFSRSEILTSTNPESASGNLTEE